jgi:hypothetical protein
MSLTTSPIICAARTRPANLSLIALALLTAVSTTSMVCRLISVIDAESSSVAFAALPTFIDASFEARTIP